MIESELEARRIVVEYERRERELAARYEPNASAEVFLRRRRRRAVARALDGDQELPLAGKAVLDVGCGSGHGLIDLASLGADRVAGIDLLPARAAAARARLMEQRALRDADVSHGNAAELPWPDAAFDVVHQCMMFSSIVAPGLRRAVAAEMARVLAPGGAVVSIDFRVDNPWNPGIRRLGQREMASLFPGFELRCRSLALPPPLTRYLLPRGRAVAEVLEAARVVNAQLLVVLRRSDP